MAKAAILFFWKNDGIGHAFYFKASFHTDEMQMTVAAILKFG